MHAPLTTTIDVGAGLPLPAARPKPIATGEWFKTQAANAKQKRKEKARLARKRREEGR